MLTGDTVWWDTSWNPIAGCKPVSPGCLNCYAAQQAGTLHQRAGAKRQARSLYAGIVNKAKGGGYAFNGKYTAELSGDPSWTFPLDYEGANHPLLGPGMPSLIFVGSMTDLFLEGRPDAIIDRVVGTVAQSDHLGLLLTRRAHRMSHYFTALRWPAATLRRLRARLWLGFSAERQQEFDTAWLHMRDLAANGWTVFTSIAPMIGPVRLPEDFLQYGDRSWVIISGEQGPLRHCRDLDHDWARAVRAQCAGAGVPLFVKQMSSRRPIPPDLFIRQFPRC